MSDVYSVDKGDWSKPLLFFKNRQEDTHITNKAMAGTGILGALLVTPVQTFSNTLPTNK